MIWLAVVPPVAIAILDPDLCRLALGAFGPPAGTVLVRWLAAGAAVAAGVALRSSRARGRVAGLAAAAGVGLAVVVFRDRHITTRDVVFAGPDITIAATIYAPKAPGPHPAVVFVHGSAPLKRGFYSLWARRLATMGVLSIVPDKRGVGGTGGEFERENNTSRANLELLAGDVVAAVDFAARQPEVDSARLGLFGLSQAGWVAPMTAARSSRVRFIVMITGPTVSVHEEGVWSDLRGDDRRRAAYSRRAAERIADTVSVAGVDARPYLAALTVPGLWLFGADDNSLPSRRCVSVLDSLHKAGKPFESRTFAGAGHLLVTRIGGALPHVATASWDAIAGWLSRAIDSP
jgi:dienelactone hydrolase